MTLLKIPENTAHNPSLISYLHITLFQVLCGSCCCCSDGLGTVSDVGAATAATGSEVGAATAATGSGEAADITPVLYKPYIWESVYALYYTTHNDLI